MKKGKKHFSETFKQDTKLQISRNPYIDKKYFIQREYRLKALAAARNG